MRISYQTSQAASVRRSARAAGLLSVALVAGGTLAHAQAPGPEAPAEEAGPEADKPSRGVWSVTSENDLFGGTDRNYSNGVRIERVSPANKVSPWLKWAADSVPFIDMSRKDLRQGLALSHAIFTPEDISQSMPDPTDRPYAGWLYLSGTAIASDKNTQDILQINLGVVGPSALGEFVQTNWHDMIEEQRPMGWDYQLKDEPGIEIIAQRMALFDGPELPLGLETDFGAYAGGALGNVRTYGGTGLVGRIGWDLESDFGPPRIRPALTGAGTFSPEQTFGAYLFAGLDGRVVLRDIFLDGNTFKDSRSVDHRNMLVGDMQAGAAVHVSNVQLAFTYVHRTEEFRRQDGAQKFGAVSVSIAY
ncbi:lipid A deacylase LpxR family protein [Henriciella aquimarina]|uniref:lipid A deacylase LpxR family protein n=1 Tax=Henriciella aquimarina TaxID=545261 RepID=UPI000A03CBC3|nr:lipid A deacylase LpxR family protein [Henriciella aquimarina]